MITKNRFEKILFPSRRFRSSLYRKLTGQYAQYLDEKDTRVKFEYIKKQKK